MYRKFALFAATLSVFSVALIGCQKEAEAPAGQTKEAQDAAGNAAAKAREAAGVAADAGKAAVVPTVSDPVQLLEALKAEAGLAGVKIQKNDKGELVMTGKVADQGLKAKAEELIKAAGGTVKNAIIVGK